MLKKNGEVRPASQIAHRNIGTRSERRTIGAGASLSRVSLRRTRALRLPALVNRPDHVPNGAELIILLNVQLHSHRPRPRVIVERQSSLPVAGNSLPCQT